MMHQASLVVCLKLEIGLGRRENTMLARFFKLGEPGKRSFSSPSLRIVNCSLYTSAPLSPFFSLESPF
jgi:hypothetical protein